MACAFLEKSMEHTIIEIILTSTRQDMFLYAPNTLATTYTYVVYISKKEYMSK